MPECRYSLSYLSANNILPVSIIFSKSLQFEIRKLAQKMVAEMYEILPVLRVKVCFLHRTAIQSILGLQCLLAYQKKEHILSFNIVYNIRAFA